MLKSRTLKSALALLLLLGIIIGLVPEIGHAENNKKVIVLILDEMSLEDIKNPLAYTSYGHKPSIGLMNSKAKSSVNNLGSSYLSLGMGVRTLASTQGNLAFSKDYSYNISQNENIETRVNIEDFYKSQTGSKASNGEIINIAIEDIKRVAKDITPNNEVGLLGRVARENNLTIGAIGNSDISSPSREFTMLAMDENGNIPYGYVGEDLLMSDPSVLGGVRLDNEKLLKEVERILPKVDILFIDYGDSSRVQKNDRLASDFARVDNRSQVVANASELMENISYLVDKDNTMFMAISPNPSKKMLSDGNFSLTPILISEKDFQDQLLTSATTRRAGLISNFDFAPTILNYFGIREQAFIGSNIKTVENSNPRASLLKMEDDFIYIRKYRKVFHWTLIILIVLDLVGLYISSFTKFKKIPEKLLKYLSLTIFASPLTMMTVSLIGYKNIVLDILFIVLVSFLIGFILSRAFKSSLKTIGILGILTSIFLLVDGYFLQELMIISPLGSDAIAGGRFYGIGNDYMGLLLGSSLLALFIFFENKKTPKLTNVIITGLVLGIIIVGLSPLIGANMGGTLSALFIFFTSILLLLDKKFSLRKLIYIGLVVLVGILGLASLDAIFNPSPTHAGKAIIALTTGGYSKLFEIIDIKLRQVFWNIAHASWNIVLFLQLGLMLFIYAFKKDILLDLRNKYASLFKGFATILLGSLFIFMFNDTGTIAAAIILYYVFIPLGLLLNNID